MSSKAEAAEAGVVYPPLPRAPEGQYPPSYDQATGPPPQPGFHAVPLQQAQYPNQPVLQSEFNLHAISSHNITNFCKIAAVIMAPPIGPHSTRTQCRSCQADISTRISHDTSTRTHLFALLCCLM